MELSLSYYCVASFMYLQVLLDVIVTSMVHASSIMVHNDALVSMGVCTQLTTYSYIIIIIELHFTYWCPWLTHETTS